VNDMEQRVRISFAAQGLMDTLGARLARVAESEVQIALPFVLARYARSPTRVQKAIELLC